MLSTPEDFSAKWPECPTCNSRKPPHYFAGKICKDCKASYDSEFDPSVAEKVADRNERYTPEDDLEIPLPKYDHIAEQNDYIESAKKALVRRELARRKLLPFIIEFKAGYKAGWVHKDICRRLEKFSEDVKQEKSPRLMLFMPPRSGKSEIVSRNFPAWHLGANPTHEIIACSYAASLANSFSRKVRDILRDPAYHAMFERTRLDKESQAVENWLLTEGGGYVAAGVGGSIVGKGAHILIIDDPTKGRDEAKSESVQESIRDWYTGSAYTRLTSGGGVLMVMQRWAEDDLAGWLLQLDEDNENEDTRENWEVVRYPAIAEEDEVYRNKGEALHPERYNETALGRIRATLGERDWYALYQQTPIPSEGTYFKEEHFNYYKPSECPPLDELRIYAAFDFAVATDEENDFTACCVVGVDSNRTIWVLHFQLYKQDTLETCEEIFRIWDVYSPELIGAEEGQISKSIGPFLDLMMEERGVYVFIEPLKPGRKDKQMRAQSIRGRMQQGKVLFPKHDGKSNDCVAQMLKFPDGKNDDAVDAIAYIGIIVNKMFPPTAIVEKKKTAAWREEFMKKQLRKQSSSDEDSTFMAV